MVAVGQHPFKLRPGESARLGGEGEELVEAPDCVRQTLDLAIDAAQKLARMPELAQDLNEVLTMGYFAEQQMVSAPTALVIRTDLC